MKNNFFLLPYKSKIIGLLLILIGLMLAYTYFFIGKPDFLNIKVFAIASFYMKKTFFSIINTNIIDELGAFFIVLGLTITFFSRTKNEKKKQYNDLRVKSIINSIWITFAFWAVSIFTIYGMAIFIVSSIVFLFFLLCCNLLFVVYLSKKHRVK